MGVQQSSKQGVQSDSQKRDNARYMEEAAPNSAPVAGAFGREGGPEGSWPGGPQERPVADRASVLAAEEDDDDLDDDDDDDDDDEVPDDDQDDEDHEDDEDDD